MKIKKKATTSKRPYYLVFLLVVVAVLGYGVYAQHFKTWPFTNTSETPESTEVEGDDTTPDTNDRETDSGSTSIDRGNTQVRDTGGQDNTAQQGVSSESGAITLYSPSSNALITDGSSISGRSSYSAVNYRLVDDEIGLLVTGRLNVVNGSFSGEISIDSKADSGKLDVFYARSDGGEVDVITTLVRFK